MTSNVLFDEEAAMEAMESEIAQVESDLVASFEKYDYLDGIYTRIARTGKVDRVTMRSLENLFPEAIHPDFPVNSYTQESTDQNLSVSMEGFKNAIRKVLDVIKKALSKLINAILSLFRKDPVEKRAEQAEKEQEKREDYISSDDIRKLMESNPENVVSNTIEKKLGTDELRDRGDLAQAYFDAFSSPDSDFIQEMLRTFEASLDRSEIMEESLEKLGEVLKAQEDLGENPSNEELKSFFEEQNKILMSVFKKRDKDPDVETYLMEALNHISDERLMRMEPQERREKMAKLASARNFAENVRSHIRDTKEYIQGLTHEDQMENFTAVTKEILDHYKKHKRDWGKTKDKLTDSLLHIDKSFQKGRATPGPKSTTVEPDGTIVVDMGEGTAISDEVRRLEDQFNNNARHLFRELHSEMNAIHRVYGVYSGLMAVCTMIEFDIQRYAKMYVQEHEE